MAIIKKYKSEVVDITEPFIGIYVVSLKSLEKPYKYSPGQFLHLALDNYDPSFPWPESRCFSMQSSEQDPLIKITYAAKGSFTNRMAKELTAGKQIYLKLPYGELFTRPHSKVKTVFIAGGTGVTPYLSLFTSGGFTDYQGPKLYLGVRDKNYSIYDRELTKSKDNNPSFKIVMRYQDSEGMLSIEKIFNENGASSTYFISGPPVMIKNFKKYLLEQKIPEDQIRTDDWE